MENEHQANSVDFNESTMSIVSPSVKHFESTVSAVNRRRWSMTRQMINVLKRAGHAFSSSVSDSESLAAESRRNSEQSSTPTYRRSSIDSNASDKSNKSPLEFIQRARRMSLDSGKSIKFNLERDETLYPVAEIIDDDVQALNPAGEEESSANAGLGSGTPASSCVAKPVLNYVCANSGAVPDDVENVCVITPGADIDEAIVPNTVNDVVVARLDRMSPNEQLILKCASVLGMNFTRELLSAIVPRKTASVLDTTLYRLSKERLLECGSLALNQSQQHNSNRELAGRPNHYSHHKQDQKPKNQVLCGCYANEGLPTVNLSQTARQSLGRKKLCLYFHFSNTLIREAAYDLWLEDQRHALHERAAMFLETQIHLCKSCGGTSFVPGVKSKMAHRSNVLVRDLGNSLHWQFV